MKTMQRTLLAVLALCLIMPALHAQADTAADIAKIDAHLKRAQVNLDSVNGSIGHRTTPPKGSAAKLAKVRLDQARPDIEAAGKLVAGLTKGGAGVADATAKYEAAAALYTKLANILSGGEKPADTGIKDGEVKLGYPHADNFKNTQFTFRNKVLAQANKLVELHAELKPVKDQLLINHRTTANAMATIKEARRQAVFVKDGLAKIPANGQGVAAAKENLAKALESIKGSEAYFAPLNEKLMEMVDPANYPKYNDDRKRLQGLASDYSADWVFTSDRPRAAELFTQRQAAQEELVRIARAYQRLMQQKTQQGITIEQVGNNTLGSFKAFDAKVEDEKKSLPKSIREHMTEAQAFGDTAVKEQKPAYFTGGIPQRMEWAQDKLTLLKVIDPDGSQAVAKEFADVEAKLKKQADSLKALIIKENRVPATKYAGNDADAIIKVAKSAWAVQQKDAKILAISMPVEQWSREKKWTYSNGTWYYTDKSRIQIRLIVQDHENPKQAIDRPINIVKDHQKGDKMIGIPFRSFDEKLTPGEYYLVENVK